MKTILTKSFAILLFISIASSCKLNGFNKITGNNNVITEERNIRNNFTKIEVGQGISVLLSMGKKTEVIVEADENLMDIIKTEVKNGVLKIYTEENIWKAKSRKVYVTAPNIDAISASSGSSVTSENTIISDNFKIDTSSGSRVNLILNSETVSSSSSSGSSITLSGKTFSHVSQASSGSSIKAIDMKSSEADASVSSGAHIKVNATKKLNARASSGGGIRYSGNPENINRKSSSGGSVSSY